MSLTRPKLQLDERSFQGLLAAAFTIQEHADLLKHITEVSPEARPDVSSKPSPEPHAEEPRLCRYCAAPLKEGESRCGQCGVDQFRPGERMQHKFASLWEMSQEHGVRQQRPPESGEESVLELASSVNESPEPSPALQPAPRTGQEWKADPPIEAFPVAIAEESTPAETKSLPTTSRDVLLELRQLIDLHRADLYLGIAVLVAVFALLWPTPAAPQKPRLEPWQRVLVKLGIAEAPAPQIHYRGDPNIEVWVDPHTALYYCPGEDLYGKTDDGRRTGQRDAQADHFEPANRAACN